MKKFFAALATALSAVVLTIATPASAAGYDWHVFNSSTSNAWVTLWSFSSCGGSSHLLYPGQKATSWGWDSIEVQASDFHVRVYDDKTGNELAYRWYSAGSCVNLAGNSYKVIIP